MNDVIGLAATGFLMVSCFILIGPAFSLKEKLHYLFWVASTAAFSVCLVFNMYALGITVWVFWCACTCPWLRVKANG